MLSPGLRSLLRDYWLEARPEGWLFPGNPKINPISSRQLNRAFTSAKLPLIAVNSDCRAVHGRNIQASNATYAAP
jgi:hypothetical protein